MSYSQEASSQSSRRAGVSAVSRRPLSFSPSKKIITLDDIQAQAPNVAFIPDEADAISYESILLGVSEQAVAKASDPQKPAAPEKKTAAVKPAAKAARPKSKETARAAAPK
ncbi:MAG: hypothetical protein LBO78_01275, partial [Rickettsiales bacterium]|nr:hypothetical protein [Rickettsiales bacterium]